MPEVSEMQDDEYEDINGIVNSRFNVLLLLFYQRKHVNVPIDDEP